jgi:lysozyme
VKLTQGQFDALVSFAYNVGSRALSTSTLSTEPDVKDDE